MAQNRLDRDAWLLAATSALIEEGPGALRVEPLARALGVTKGSFYWHFKDRAALRAAVLTKWFEDATLGVINHVDGAAGSPEERLRELITASFSHAGRRDRAFRAWAAQDDAAALMVEQVDRRRLDYVQALFEASGQPRRIARLRARVAYAALVGEQHLAVTLPKAQRVDAALAMVELLLQ